MERPFQPAKMLFEMEKGKRLPGQKLYEDRKGGKKNEKEEETGR